MKLHNVLIARVIVAVEFAEVPTLWEHISEMYHIESSRWFYSQWLCLLIRFTVIVVK